MGKRIGLIEHDSMSHGGHKLDIDVTVRDDMLLDTPNRQGNEYGIYYSSSSDKYYGHNRYHPYRRSDRGYFSDDVYII